MAIDEPTSLLVGATRYRPTSVVTARRLAEPLTWRGPDGSPLRARAGDWELCSDTGDRWTIDHDWFVRSYRRLPDGRYAKAEEVEAVRLTRDTDIPTREGPIRAGTGFWLLRDAEGAMWAVPDATFRSRYRRAD